jgi:hypothetical protein
MHASAPPPPSSQRSASLAGSAGSADRARKGEAERSISVTVAAVVYVLVLALWAGGLIVLGAVVAPTVFRIVPAPTSADAMTVVFRRFDVIAMTCSVIALLAEAGLAWRGGRPRRVDVVRAGSTVVAAVLAIVEGLYLSPAIQGLHRDGAVRGWGEPGQALERLHRMAETSAKAELVFLLMSLVLVVLRVRRSGQVGAATPAL